MNFIVKTLEDNKHQVVELTTDITEVLAAANNNFSSHCVNVPHNIDTIRTRFLSNSGKEKYEVFSGGTYEDLFKIPDMTPFERAKKMLESSSFMKKIVQKNNLVNRRKRTFSEHEGEWDIGRQWEIKPFSNAKRLPTMAKFVDIYCHFNIACQVDQEQITRYGTVIWAMNAALETAGVNTRIFYVQNAHSVAKGYENNGMWTSTKIKMLLKEPSKYMSPIALAKCLTSNFYRRIIFSLMVTSVDYVRCAHDYGLGHPDNTDKVLEFTEGALHVWPDVLNAGEKNVEKAIMDIIESA